MLGAAVVVAEIVEVVVAVTDWLAAHGHGYGSRQIPTVNSEIKQIQTLFPLIFTD